MRLARFVVHGLNESDKDSPYEKAKHTIDRFCTQNILNSGESLSIHKTFLIGE